VRVRGVRVREGLKVGLSKSRKVEKFGILNLNHFVD